jgi:hypothetical protein
VAARLSNDETQGQSSDRARKSTRGEPFLGLSSHELRTTIFSRRSPMATSDKPALSDRQTRRRPRRFAAPGLAKSAATRYRAACSRAPIRPPSQARRPPPRRRSRPGRAPATRPKPRPKPPFSPAPRSPGSMRSCAKIRRGPAPGASASPCMPRPPASPAPAAAKTRRRCATRSTSLDRAPIPDRRDAGCGPGARSRPDRSDNGAPRSQSPPRPWISPRARPYKRRSRPPRLASPDIASRRSRPRAPMNWRVAR